MENSRDVDDKMSPNELYCILQTDMVSIKSHQEALKCELSEIRSQFKHLIENCGIDPLVTPSQPKKHSDGSTVPRFYSVPVSTPQQNLPTPKRNFHTPHQNFHTPQQNFHTPQQNFHTPQRNDYQEQIIRMLMDIPSSGVEETSSDSPPQSVPCLDKNHNTLLQDESIHNSYISDGSPIPPCPVTPDVIRSTRKNPDQREPVSIQAIISRLIKEERCDNKENHYANNDSSSTGYPKSTESSDTQFQTMSPEREQELLSRMKYYCDFAVERNSKILKKTNCSRNKVYLPEQRLVPEEHTVVPDDPMTRHVEGSETKVKTALRTPGSCVKLNNINRSSSMCPRSVPFRENIKVAQVTKLRRSSCAKRDLCSFLKSVKKHRASSDSTNCSYNSRSTTSSNTSHVNNRHRSTDHQRKHHINQPPFLSPMRNDTLQRVQTQQHNDMCSFFVDQVTDMASSKFNNESLVPDIYSFHDDGYKSQTLPRKRMIPTTDNSKQNSSSWPNISKNPTQQDKHHHSSTPNNLNHRPGSESMRLTCIERSPDTEGADSVFTDSPRSFSSGGRNAPCNSRNSPFNIDNESHFTPNNKSVDVRDFSIIPPNSSTLDNLSFIDNVDDTFKVPKTPIRRHKTMKHKPINTDRCSTPVIRTSTPMPKIPRVHYLTTTELNNQSSRKKLFSKSPSSSSSSGHTRSTTPLNKRALIKRFKRFSENFYRIKAGKIQIETLANL